MTHVGFLYNASRRTGPAERLSLSLFNRALLVDEALRRAGHRLFLYSPRDVTVDGSDVPGHVIEGTDFVPATRPVPHVNGNWTSGSRSLLDKGMGYERFLAWTRERGIGVYAPYEFSRLVSDKYRTYEAVRTFDAALHPHTERFDGRGRTIERFLERAGTVFLKPRWGNKGDGILVVRRDGDGFALAVYGSRAMETSAAPTLTALVDAIRDARDDTRYVIQEGVDALRYEGSAFDIRIIAVDDGRAWRCVSEARIGGRGRDISNIGQGGRYLDPAVVLRDLFGPDGGPRTMAAMVERAGALGDHFDASYPGAIMEYALDYMIDASGALRLAEINTKPGLAGIGYFTRVTELGREDAEAWAQYVTPHTDALSSFLLRKVEQAGARPVPTPAR